MSRHSFEHGTDTWTIGNDIHQASYFVQRLDERHEDLHDLGGALVALPTLEDAERLLPAETRARLASEQPADPAGRPRPRATAWLASASSCAWRWRTQRRHAVHGRRRAALLHLRSPAPQGASSLHRPAAYER